MKRTFLPALAGAALALSASFAGAATLDTVKQKGFLQCGVNTGLPGFGNPNEKGEWTGFDVDYCRAIASAVFGDPTKVKFTPLDAKERFTALQSGEVDVLIRNTTWTMSRDTSLGLKFAGVNYYDGQGFMVKKSLGVKSVNELSGASICVQSGTDTELNLADYFKSHNMQYNPVVFEKVSEANSAYDSGRCDAYTTDQSGLYATRLQLQKPDDTIVLPEIISKEPLGPVVRQGDDVWFNVVKWTHYALLDAEELGVTQQNADQMKSSDNPDIKRLLGVQGNFGQGIGLSNDWAYKIVKGVGNYGELFEKDLGQSSPLKIQRGENALWNKGGLQYGMPIL
ncbi:general L-amino acid-binding protein [Faunimonas pinastri]|uniref:General L-amino acid-binding protein n=1 Tax=Faunimonas pinastri TaxID=1855383 RepID=A0A1H9CKV9_9HYPH|nr:amino acid ABC transporter substrate-binding protein [Faunimonas pinastri]SEQ01343.1 general L-amino acid-binding protein [Faunimonas pinastri]